MASLRLQFVLKKCVENAIKRGRNYHSDIFKVPYVPLLIHDSEYHLFPESDQAFNLFMPDLSELKYNEFKTKGIEKLNDSLIQGQRILKRASEINLILNSNQVIQTAKDIPSKVLKNNYFIGNEGTIVVEKILQLEKLMATTKDKLAEISRKISDTREVARVWESVKIKLPSWQNTIANKLQGFQDRVNKKTIPTKKEGNV